MKPVRVLIAHINLWVAPHTGAWIETPVASHSMLTPKSHPTRVRGLKQYVLRGIKSRHVAPHTGAWIETLPKMIAKFSLSRRTPHGCVD